MDLETFMQKCADKLGHDSRVNSADKAVVVSELVRLFSEAGEQITPVWPPGMRKVAHNILNLFAIEGETKQRKQDGTGAIVFTPPEAKRVAEVLEAGVPEAQRIYNVMRDRVRYAAAMRRTYRCEDCGCSLTPFDALINWSGLGPYCEACVEADEWLFARKWEAIL